MELSLFNPYFYWVLSIGNLSGRISQAIFDGRSTEYIVFTIISTLIIQLILWVILWAIKNLRITRR